MANTCVRVKEKIRHLRLPSSSSEIELVWTKGKMKHLREQLPLLQVLSELKGYQRQIIIDALDSKGCAALKSCLKLVATKGSKLGCANKLRKCVSANRKSFDNILYKKGRSQSVTRREIARVGGNPLLFILSAAIPLILDLIKK